MFFHYSGALTQNTMQERLKLECLYSKSYTSQRQSPRQREAITRLGCLRHEFPPQMISHQSKHLKDAEKNIFSFPLFDQCKK